MDGMMTQLSGTNLLDIIVLALCLWFSIAGAVKGFVYTFFKLAVLILSAYLAKVYSSVVSYYLTDHFQWAESSVLQIQSFLTEILDKIGINAELIDTLKLEQVKGLLTPDVRAGLSAQGISPEVAEKVLASKHLELLALDQGTISGITGHLSQMIFSGLVMVALFLLFYALASVLVVLLDRIADLPVLSTMNAFFGFLFGLLKAIVLIWVLMAMVQPYTLVNPDSAISQWVQTAKLGHWLFAYNPIAWFVFN
jgi:uncharacterized membrane protein required for colicin V production